MRNKACPIVALGIGLWLAWTGCVQAFFPWRYRAAAGCTEVVEVPRGGPELGSPAFGSPMFGSPMFGAPPFGGSAPEYGKDPRIVPRSYPWHVPSMYSGFRHYHMPPPVAPDAELGPPRGGPVEESPVPRKKL